MSDELRGLIGDAAMDRVLARLRGAPHLHHKDCIHNLSPDEQIDLRGFTREEWEQWGFAEPTQITPKDWTVNE